MNWISEVPATLELPVTQSAALEPVPYLTRKRLGVRILGIVLGVPLTPVILVLIGAVRLTSPGPGLYQQRRVGLNGREFTMYKLRSMRRDAEDLSGPVWAAQKDNRVTPLGKFLRWTHLDELPQIFNVIRGEMDLVGPRPERPEIVDDLITQITDYQIRHAAMPGITGLAQVNLPPDQTIDCVRYKIAADQHYIRSASLWLDLRLIAATVLRSFGVRYALGARLLRVELPESLRQLANHVCDSETVEAAPCVRVVNARSPSLVDTAVFAAVTDTVVEDPEGDLTFDHASPMQPFHLPR